MHVVLRIALVAVTGLALGGCAVGQRLGWTANRAEPTDVVRANCEILVNTLKGQPDHGVAMNACVDAKTRQHRN